MNEIDLLNEPFRLTVRLPQSAAVHLVSPENMSFIDFLRDRSTQTDFEIFKQTYPDVQSGPIAEEVELL